LSSLLELYIDEQVSFKILLASGQCKVLHMGSNIAFWCSLLRTHQLLY